MKKILTLLLFSLLSAGAFAQNAAKEYIERYKDLAIQNMNTYGTPASVILAVAIHESASGNSKIARYLNNHFGMKGRNTSKEIRSSYKGYESAESSYQDFISMLSSRPQFSHLFDKFSHYDYKGWIFGINRGGYAASRQWAGQVLGIIKKYRLYEYDNRPAEVAEPKPVVTRVTPRAEAAKYYKVQKGDNLNSIAEKLGTTPKKLMQKNSLRSSLLQTGQKLKI